MRLVFDVRYAGEAGAGLSPYTDSVTVEIESGEPGGEPGEFTEYMRKALEDWFDGATVRIGAAPDTGNGSIYYVTPTQGMRVKRTTRYGTRYGTVLRINARSVTIAWDDSFSGDGVQRVTSYELTSIFPAEEKSLAPPE